MIEYKSRYSKTDEYDKHGRWARIAYFRGIKIAWINKIYIENKNIDIFSISCDFPTMGNDTANEHKTLYSLEESKEWIEERWEYFRDKIK